MSVTKRFLAAAAACAAISLLCAAFAPGAALALFAAFNAGLAALLLADYLISPNERAFSVSRPEEQRLYLGAENRISLTVASSFPRPVRVSGAADNLCSRFFGISGGDMSGEIPAMGERVFGYTAIPRKRGSFVSDGVRIGVRGVLGFCEKRFEIKSPADYKVYPNVRDLSRYRLVMMRRLRERGDKIVRAHGGGTEFERLRDYVEGDDHRKINWLATARERKLVVNNYQAERNQPVFILLDTGRPLSYEAGGMKKLDYSINAALILADIVNQNGDKCGLVVFNRETGAFIRPGNSLAHRNLLMETLYHAESSRDTSDYENVFIELGRRHSRRSLIFLFSDFETAGEARDMTKSLTLLTRRHVVVSILMKNAFAEAAAGLSPAKSPDEIYLKGAACDYLAERRRIIRILNRNGAACVESRPDEFALTAVNKYLELKG